MKGGRGQDRDRGRETGTEEETDRERGREGGTEREETYCLVVATIPEIHGKYNVHVQSFLYMYMYYIHVHAACTYMCVCACTCMCNIT